MITQFIDKKSIQLAYYIKGYWSNFVPYSELKLFLWDTLEEWAQLPTEEISSYGHKERVFWHVIHQVHLWDKRITQSDILINDDVERCIIYLEHNERCPREVIGIRP